jgi:predicted GNAT family acetyltransferase
VSDDVRVTDSPAELAYKLTVGGREAGALYYGRRGDRLVLDHTEVDPAFEGLGLGSKLVAGALEDIRARGLEIVPLCPFVRRYLQRHPEYADLVRA